MTGYTDYRFLLPVPENINMEISRYKKASVKHIGSFQSMDSPAHISLKTLERQKPYYADQTIERLELQLKTLPPVLLHINGFAYFPHLHGKMTIYAAIKSTPAADNWFEEIKKQLKVKKGILPHITVCRNIAGADFEKLWPHFRHKHWLEPFWVDQLKISKRDSLDRYGNFNAFKTIRFKNTQHLHNEANKSSTDEQINLF
ncbi:2'-5' RNA ligase family protein [Mucilaginibacter litoreus]|uniref:2'-5' RNA ligase family protein n=1 Tax=Mucilaginibacter litoreus TaxID=1048221 RepID=A0ABW3ASJ6_9SPHI